MPLPNTNKPAGVNIGFALLSNKDINEETSEKNVITMDPINMDHNLFKYLFYYNSSESFTIAKANDAYSLLKFHNFTLNGNPLSLVNIFMTAYENNNNTNRNSLSPLVNITLVKSMSQYSSVVDVLPYSISLSYADLIMALVDSLVIQPSNSVNDYAEVTLLLSVRISSEALKTTITFNIPIITNIRGYINPNSIPHPVYVPPRPLQLPIVKVASKSDDITGKYSYEEIHDENESTDSSNVVNNKFKQEKMEENKLNLKNRENLSADNSVIGDHEETSSDDAEVGW
jgi:hypothetical protein